MDTHRGGRSVTYNDDDPPNGRRAHALTRPRGADGSFLPQFDPEELMPAALDRLLAGETLAEIFSGPDMPTRGYFMQQVARNPHWAERYAEIRTLQADLFADDLREVTRDVLAGKLPPDAARVAGQHIMWLAGVSNRRRYGKDAEIKHTGEVQHVHALGISDRLTRARLRAIENSAEAPIDDGAVIEGTAVTVRTTDAGD
jgi:hypothetical protein